MADIFGYENKKYDVVMFNMGTMYDFDHGIVNRNYHIIKNLQREKNINRIIAVDFLPVGWPRALKHYWKNILLGVKQTDMVYGDLTSACYQKTNKLFVYTSIDSVFSWKTVARELRRIEKILHLNNIIFWSYNPMFIDFIGKLREKLFVFDTVDNWTEHTAYTKLMKKSHLTENYQEIANRADIIFTVSNGLKDFYRGFGREHDVNWVPNGVDFDHYNDPELLNRDNDLDKIGEPIIGYIGTIEDRLDLDLIAYIATNNPDKKVVLAGPIWKTVEDEVTEKLKPLNNVLLPGRIHYDDAPALIANFDVCIIPHKTSNRLVASMNPMKLYEYLACGKPIVSTPGAGTEVFRELINITDNYNDFNGLINYALQTDSPAKQQERRETAKKHSWQQRLAEMMEVINNKLNETHE